MLDSRESLLYKGGHRHPGASRGSNSGAGDTTMLKTQEHYDLMAMFERDFSGRMDKERKELWAQGIVYQDGNVNELFKAYRLGYAYGKAFARVEA